MPRRKKSEERLALEFAFLLTGLGAVSAGIALWRHHAARAWIFGAIGVAAPLLALAVKPLWLAFFRSWMKLAEGMGWVTTRVILTLFFFLVLTPVGLLRRAMGRPTLDTRWKDGKISYWVPKEPIEPTIERYAKRF
jgi:hypothetical protein